MDVYAAAERLMGMDARSWTRHANPWSGLSRFTALPLLTLAIWSRVWLGWWSLVPVALAMAWIWVNPRLFPPPADFGSWMSRGVLGERVFLARDRFDVPAHHRRWAGALTAASASGLPPYVYGLVVLDLGWTVAGIVLLVLPKTWFVDRMVWIHADVTGSRPGTPLPQPVPFQGDTP